MTAKTPRGQSGLDDRPASRRWLGEVCRRPQWLQSWVVTEPEAVEAAQSQPGAIEIGEAAAFLCRERARCKVLHGGRGGLKSWSAARTAAHEDLRYNPVRNSNRAGIMEKFATPAGWLADRCIDWTTSLGLLRDALPAPCFGPPPVQRARGVVIGRHEARRRQRRF